MWNTRQRDNCVDWRLRPQLCHTVGDIAAKKIAGAQFATSISDMSVDIFVEKPRISFWNPIHIFLCPPDTTSTALWRSSPNCQRREVAMPVLFFLPPGWVKSSQVPQPTWFWTWLLSYAWRGACLVKSNSFQLAGSCCCRRTRWLQLPFLRADATPWSSCLDSHCLTPTGFERCSRINCGRQGQAGWRKGWKLQQTRGDGWRFNGLGVNIHFKAC